MKKLLIPLFILFAICSLFVSCSDEENLPTNYEYSDDSVKRFTLTLDEPETIDVLTTGPIWNNLTSQSDCPIVVLSRKTSRPDSYLKPSKVGGFWKREDGKVAPATYLFNAGSNDSLFEVEIECVNEEQGLCCVKFSSNKIDASKRDEYKGKWEIRIGKKEKYTSVPELNDILSEVIFSAYVTIE